MDWQEQVPDKIYDWKIAVVGKVSGEWVSAEESFDDYKERVTQKAIMLKDW